MAQKKITDLQLISAVVDSANYMVDTGVQTYRSTATQLMTYIYTKLNALSAVDALAADFVLGLDASDSNNPKRFAVSRFKNAVYRSVTTTDSVGADDETMVLSGASFTSTLPTAVGVAGKRYKFLHAGTSLSQVYTLATTSSQTIGGIAGGSYALYTVGECLEIESDGANWIIVNHYATTAPTSFTPSVGGTTGFGTVSSAAGMWHRKGDILFGEGSWVNGTTATATGAVALPGSLTFNTAKISTSGNNVTQHGPTAGFYRTSDTATGARNGYLIFASATSTSNMYFSVLEGIAGVDHSIPSQAIGTNVTGSGQKVEFNFMVPISGWQP